MSKRQTILVTGGAGFIGSHVVERLLTDGAEVIVIDNLSTGSRANIPDGATFYCGDISERAFVSKVFSQHAFNGIVHEAACINTSILTEDPATDVRISLSGTINLLDMARSYNVGKFIFASSLAVYGQPDKLPVSEDTPPQPIYSYGIAKLCAESYVQFYGKVHGLSHVILRYGNIYGPRQPIYGEVGVIAIFTQKTIEGTPITIFGDGEHQRDFLYVSDAADATVRFLDSEDQGTYIVASGEAVSVNQLVDLFDKASETPLVTIRKPERVGEIGKYYSSISRLKKTLNWTPQTDIKTGLAKTLEYERRQKLPLDE